MFKVFFLLFFSLFVFSFSWSQVPIGSSIKNPKTTFKNANGPSTSIIQEVKQNGLIVIFSCNTCPFVVGSKHFPGWENQYNDLFDTSMKNNIGFVLINSNEAKRQGDDAFDKMETHATENNYKMSYLMDENSIFANELLAKTTPHVFFYNANLELIYTGSIDNIWDGKRKKEQFFLRDAIDNHVKSKKIKPANSPPKGCSIKRMKP
tara:strand:- start:261 stop:878 length:618 start_codon:yes stop_codon:yes gene_type:complete